MIRTSYICVFLSELITILKIALTDKGHCRGLVAFIATECTFSAVVHANNAENVAGYGVAGGTTLDAMRDVQGRCKTPF